MLIHPDKQKNLKKYCSFTMLLLLSTQRISKRTSFQSSRALSGITGFSDSWGKGVEIAKSMWWKSQDINAHSAALWAKCEFLNMITFRVSGI